MYWHWVRMHNVPHALPYFLSYTVFYFVVDRTIFISFFFIQWILLTFINYSSLSPYITVLYFFCFIFASSFWTPFLFFPPPRRLEKLYFEESSPLPSNRHLEENEHPPKNPLICLVVLDNALFCILGMLSRWRTLSWCSSYRRLHLSCRSLRWPPSWLVTWAIYIPIAATSSVIDGPSDDSTGFMGLLFTSYSAFSLFFSWLVFFLSYFHYSFL